MPKRRSGPPVSWWGERWLAAVVRSSEPSRLARGRTYARAERVTDLALEPGMVIARVQGSRAAPYHVEIRVPTFDDQLWRQTIGALAAHAGIAGALLIGELPIAVEEMFAALGVSLFPTPAERVAIACSCPDWERPCKHAAAVCLVVADALDRDPFVLFALRGRARDELVAGLRALRTVESAPRGSALAAVTAEADEETLALTVERFWQSPVGPALDRPSPEPATPAHRRLGPPPAALGGAQLRAELATAYRVIVERATRAGEPGAASSPRR
jgi:uncharacterized Zn finger protein